MTMEPDFGWIDDDNLISIDRFAAGQIAPGPSRSKVINAAIRDWAPRQGLRHQEPISKAAQSYDSQNGTSHDQASGGGP